MMSNDDDDDDDKPVRDEEFTRFVYVRIQNVTDKWIETHTHLLEEYSSDVRDKSNNFYKYNIVHSNEMRLICQIDHYTK